VVQPGVRPARTEPPDVSGSVGRLDDPYAQLGGEPSLQTTRDTKFPPAWRDGLHRSRHQLHRESAVEPFRSERQLASNWGASVSYLGSHSDRFWGSLDINQGLYLGSGPCTNQWRVVPGVHRARQSHQPAPAGPAEILTESQYIGNAYIFDDPVHAELSRR
jgi:hypothetical protein